MFWTNLKHILYVCIIQMLKSGNEDIDIHNNEIADIILTETDDKNSDYPDLAPKTTITGI